MAYLSYMPQSFAAACRAQTDVCPEDIHTEYRLRAGGCSAVTYNTPSGENASLVLQDVTLTEDDLRRVLLRFCRGSLYAYDAPMRRGYLTPAGFPGLRIGVAGRALCDGSSVIGLQSVSSLCVRLPHPYLMETDDMLDMILRGDAVTETDTPSADKHRPTKKRVCSTLFYAPPGIGKTTLLRAVISHLADAAQLCPLCVAVIDTGEELYIPSDASLTADVFSAYPRGVGLAIAARAFSPDVLS